MSHIGKPSPCQFVFNPSEQLDVSPVPVPDCPPPAKADLPSFIFDLLVSLRENIKLKLANLLSWEIAPVICSLVDPLASCKWGLKEAGGGERGGVEEPHSHKQTNFAPV